MCLYFFSRSSRPISINLDTNHSWVKGIQNYINKGPGSLPRESRYHKNAKMGWVHLKSFFSRTTEPEQLIFT
jgi:hypothetical protein